MTKSMEAWEFMLNNTAIARYFSGIFNHMGIEVIETGEKFTVHHQQDGFTFSEGITNNADYHIKLGQQNIENMKSHGADGTIDADESFRITSVLFTPLTQSSMSNPVLSQPFYRKLAGIENHIIVHLEHPTKDETASHTIIYLNKEWLVVPGAHGNARRTFRINPSQAIEYQRKVFIALQDGSFSAWQNFKKWYFKWRKDVSVKH